MNQQQLASAINAGELDSVFNELYPGKDNARSRYTELLACHENEYGANGEVFLFSAPGRTEIGGNHTDHQHGRVLAAAIDLDIIAVVSKSNSNLIRIHSKGYPEDIIDLSDLGKKVEERNHAASLIRGVAYKMKEMGCAVSGFDAVTFSDVLSGSGLSSSAAFEVLIATIINGIFNNNRLSPVELAKISQFSEREYFGKPSGLMDQTACSVGGCVEIDFQNTNSPTINSICFKPREFGYRLVIVNTGANHADLTDDYASIPSDMGRTARFFKKDVLREVDQKEFFDDIYSVRRAVGDKALLRAIHFFEENERVPKMAQAIRDDRIEEFFRLSKASGRSSYERLQNIYSDKNPKEQSISLALYLSERILGEGGAYRVHGGGFAGTIQAYVKAEKLQQYVAEMENVFGRKCCYVLTIRSAGGKRVY